MAPRKKPPEPWRNSKAKKLLRKGIIDGDYPESMEPELIFYSKPEFQEYDFDRFKDNLDNLREAIELHQDRADDDASHLAHDHLLRGDPPAQTAKGYPRWEGSDAEKLLKADVDAGRHLAMEPSELHAFREEYEEFPLKVFRDHIQQETRSRTTSSYWMHRDGSSGPTPTWTNL